MDPSEVGYRLRFLRRFLNAAVARGTAEHVISCIRYQSGYRRFDNNFLNPPGTAATEARLNAEAQEAMDREFRLGSNVGGFVWNHKSS